MFRAVTQMWRMLPNQTKKAEAVTSRLSAMRVEGEAGGGMVRATFDGMGVMVGLDVDSTILSDKTIVEDLTVAAVNNARERIEEVQEEAMGEMMQGMAGMMKGLEGLFPKGFPGGPPGDKR